ncbi:type II toxin-antitoxin system RelE family toxin [Roseofilum casamattae]|uniref:Type II toxin-antitoxin system RelE/ParE family toxin n=1 Tax=Roseofilum casamattae BLCC-M143 TaxID=3022442 RepID=A0ABT7BUJ5_9CYAN|nr:type II toxin-antitoxin system RelE/ParE family toxin [Roseofilum casamattae]MDJ1182851.1 type II toxin-antitoxin system RelE/ParE family toxin [Roseofilum casamattae BLCC-M143]
MDVEFRKSFEKDLLKILDSKLYERIEKLIIAIEEVEALSEVSHVKKLKGAGDYYRIRLGDYRVGIKLDRGVVSFVRVLHRKDIYKYFP